MTQLTTQDEAKLLIQNAQSILITPSSPDGDSIGASLSMMLVLRKLGKDVTVVSTNEVPEYLQFLPHTDEIQPDLPGGRDFIISLNTESADVDHLKYEVEEGKINIIVTPKAGKFTGHDISFGMPSQGQYDLIIAVDTGDLVQLGSLYSDNPELFEEGPLLNIDHHASNGKFGTYNFLNYGVAATTQMLTPLIQDLEKDSGIELIDEEVATLLLVGIITDTGSFQHSNTSPEAFEIAADLLEKGARQQEIIKHIFKTKSLATLKLWGRVLSKIQYIPESKLVYSTITQQDIEDTGSSIDDSGGIIDELMSNAPDAEVVMLLKEKEPGFVSGSFRAPGNLADVSEIAGQIGGGGHKKAAGFRIKDKTMDKALVFAQQTVAAYMDEKLNPNKSQLGPSTDSDLHANAQTLEAGEKVFPNLTPAYTKPQTSVPAPSAGGEDLLRQDFLKQQAAQGPKTEEQRIKENSARFFQDKDGQTPVPTPAPTPAPAPNPAPIDPSMSVGEVLKSMQNGGTMA